MKKDFLVVVITVFLQFVAMFLAQYIFVNYSVVVINIAVIISSLILSIIGFWFFGKRKRILIFTLVFPMLNLYSLLYQINIYMI